MSSSFTFKHECIHFFTNVIIIQSLAIIRSLNEKVKECQSPFDTNIILNCSLLGVGVLRLPLLDYIVGEAMEGGKDVPPLEAGWSHHEDPVIPQPWRPLALEHNVTGTATKIILIITRTMWKCTKIFTLTCRWP